MEIDNRIYEDVKPKAELGDLLVSDDGFIFMIVKDDNGKAYRLLRLRDGNIPKRESFEYTIAKQDFYSIKSLLEDSDIRKYKLIPNKLLKLELI